MSGCEIYRIVPLQRFSDSFQDLINYHYRHDANARKKFEDLVSDYISNDLTTKPLKNETSDREKFPAKTAKDGVHFRKKRWSSLPCLEGKSKLGRLIYAVIPSKCTVYLIWIYTHDEHEGRPDDKDLKQSLLEIYKKSGI